MTNQILTAIFQVLRGQSPTAAGVVNENDNRNSLAVDFTDDSSKLSRTIAAAPAYAGASEQVAVPDDAKGFFIVTDTDGVIYSIGAEPTDGSAPATYSGWKIDAGTFPAAGSKHILPKGTSRILLVKRDVGNGATNFTVNWF